MDSTFLLVLTTTALDSHERDTFQGITISFDRLGQGIVTIGRDLAVSPQTEQLDGMVLLERVGDRRGPGIRQRVAGEINLLQGRAVANGGTEHGSNIVVQLAVGQTEKLEFLRVSGHQVPKIRFHIFHVLCSIPT